MDWRNILKSIEAEDIIRYAPRTGNPLIDIGVRVGARVLLGRGNVDAALSEETEDQVDPVTAGKVLMNSMTRMGQGVYVVCGQRGSGKSAFCCWAAQEMSDSATRRPVFSINMPKTLDWITDISPDKAEKLPPRSIVILDDTGLVFGSRDYASNVNQTLHELITLSRHKDITILANVGITSAMDKYLLDCTAIFFKRPTQLSIEIERSGLRRLLNMVLEQYEEMGETPENERAYVYALADPLRYRGLIWYPLPSGYTSAISKNKG